jgi:hypothetical protein
MPNVVQYPGNELKMYANSMKVFEPGIPIDQLLTEYMGWVYWAACTVPFAGRW